MIIVVCGLPGVGKSTVARLLAGKFRAAHLRTDLIRPELFPRPIYSSRERDRTYGEMVKRARNLLYKGPVVLDATFIMAKHRKMARLTARKVNSRFAMVEVVCPQSIVKRRLALRKNDASTATFREFLKHKKIWQKIAEPHFVVNTSRPLSPQINKIVRSI